MADSMFNQIDASYAQFEKELAAMGGKEKDDLSQGSTTTSTTVEWPIGVATPTGAATPTGSEDSQGKPREPQVQEDAVVRPARVGVVEPPRRVRRQEVPRQQPAQQPDVRLEDGHVRVERELPREAVADPPHGRRPRCAPPRGWAPCTRARSST